MDDGGAIGRARRGSAVGWLTPLIGRKSELAEVVRLVEQTRLVTLTGAGGVGKTRLALELVRDSVFTQSFERVFAELAPLDPCDRRDAPLEPVAGEIWRVVSGDSSAARRQVGAPLDAVADHFADRDGLLVLDNCEHLAVVPRVTELLLRRCPKLCVLATSRRPLELAGETIYQVPPLSVPAADAGDAVAAVLESEAGCLFLQRAQRGLPAFALDRRTAPAVAEICRRLDGLALAIELAAARVRVLSPHQILDGLTDRFDILGTGPASTLGRHRSLHASLDWSYQLLGESERRLLRQLAVASDWSLDAIDAVAAPAGALLDLLGTLVDAGLVASDDLGEIRRYRLLESVRTYAGERLRAAGEERDVRRAHLVYFRVLASRADGLLESDDGRRSLELEARNLHDALEFAIREEPAVALALTADLRHWLLLGDDHHEALAQCAAVLKADQGGDPVARAHVLHAAAMLAVFEEDYSRAGAYAAEAVPLADSSGDPGAIGVSTMLAAIAKRATDPRVSADLGRRAVELLRTSGDPHGIALAVAQVAMTEALRDRFDSVRAACAEFYSLTQQRGPAWLAVWLELALAWADLAQGDPRSGLAHAERGLELEGGRKSVGHYLALCHKLRAFTLLGEPERARGIAVSAIEEAAPLGLGVAVNALESELAQAELALGRLEAVRARALGRLSSPHFATAATAHELLVRVELAERRAGALKRHAAALREIGQHAGNDRLRALASWADGSAALVDGQLEEAKQRLQEALVLQLEGGLRPDALDTIEALAEVQLALGRPEPAARLLGAAARARDEFELARIPPRELHYGELNTRGAGLLAVDQWNRALEEGQQLTFAEVLGYARRGRGQRVGGEAGFASLTPTELKVVAAAGEGLTNAAIATRLFMSHGTVKAHLAHAYRKLDVANRLELVTLVREQQSPG